MFIFSNKADFKPQHEKARYILSFLRLFLLPVGPYFDLQVNPVFQPGFLQFTTQFVGLPQIPVKMIGIGVAAAATEKARPTTPAFRLVKNMGLPEVLPECLVLNTGKNIAQTEGLVFHELVTGIQISKGGYRQILVAGPSPIAFSKGRALYSGQY